MSDLLDLYQEIILDHNRRPRNFGSLADANCSAEGDNPLCGDRIHLEIELAEGRISDIAFQGAGCAISTASASLMTDAVKGKTLEEAHSLFEAFHDLLTSKTNGEPAEVPVDLGKLQALAGVREYPMRVKCATLAWHTLEAALLKRGEAVTTEASSE